MYIKRDASGAVCAVSVDPVGDVDDYIADDSPELETFLASNKPQAKQFLERSDLQMARVMEDTVNLLINKGVIQFTELPNAAQEKLLSRRQVRGHVNSINLLDDDDDLNI